MTSAREDKVCSLNPQIEFATSTDLFATKRFGFWRCEAWALDLHQATLHRASLSVF